MRNRLAACGVMLLLSSAGAGEIVPVSNLPLDLCTSQTVMMQTHFEALGREVKTREAMMPALNKVQALASKYSMGAKAGQPLGELMNVADAAEFSTMSAQILTANLYILAESRLQRDMKVLSQMQLLAVKQHDSPDFGLKEGSAEYNPFRYLGALSVIFKDVEHPATKNQAECSLSLALEREANAAFANFQQILSSSRELAELMQIRAKYRVPNGVPLDRSRLTPAEAARVPTLERVAAALMAGQAPFYQDMSDLRYFADVIMMRYEAQKSDLLQQGGSADTAGYDAAETARYNAFSPPMQQASGLWRLMDKEMPSEQYKNTMMILEAIGKAPKNK